MAEAGQTVRRGMTTGPGHMLGEVALLQAEAGKWVIMVSKQAWVPQ